MESNCTDLTLIGERALHHWTESGRPGVLAQLTRSLNNFTGHHADSASELPRLLYELVWIVIHAKLTKHEVLVLLKDAELTKYPKACDLLTDLLWVIGNEVETTERSHERHKSREWRNLCALVKKIGEEKLLTLLSLKATLEFDLLHDAELAPEPQLMTKKMVRINTKTLYTQTKYNLLREETEGFSKVLCLLHTGVTKSQLEATKTDLMALIGFFDLDANRVLDLVLDVYEMHPRNDCFAQLLEIFKRDSLPHIVGFKFQFYKRDPPAIDGVTTPRSLYCLAATLLYKGLLELEALLPHLSPSRGDIVKASVEHEKELIEKAGSFGKISLAGKIDPVKIDDEDEAAATKQKQDAEHNQVYGVIIGLLEVGAWEHAFAMISWFQKRGVNPLTFTPLTTELAAAVNVMIEEVYAPLSPRSLELVSGKRDGSTNLIETRLPHTSTISRYVRRVATLEDCVSEVFPVVEMIGPQLFHDEFLFTKLLRIVGKLVDNHSKKSSTSVEKDGKQCVFFDKVKSLLVGTFLPAMSLQACNPSTAFLVWDLIKMLPCDERYRIYLHWFEAYDKYPELRLKEAQVVQSTRGIMRRLTADRAKLSARGLTHVSHSNPLIVFRTMLRQIQSYDNLIQPVVESFKFVTPLGMDVLSFVLVSELSRPQKSMKVDGTHVSLWLTSLAIFSGSFYRKYPNVELAGLLHYLIKRLENWASVDLIVLCELLTKMGSCLSLEDISASQLEAQAGGPHLWYEPTDPKFQNRRAIPKLRDALIKQNLALPLSVLICQMRSRIEYHEDRNLPHLKLLGRVFDTCQLTLSQLMQFLGGVVDPLVYQKMLPSITTLVREYNVPPELAMSLCRPAMRSDDPVLQTVPRGVHATGGSNTTNTGVSTNGSVSNGTSDKDKSWYMYDPTLLEDIKDALRVDDDSGDKTEGPFTGLTPEVYATFWGLKLYDIHIPFQQYESEILRLRNSVTSGANASLSASERKKLKEKTAQMIDVLTTEQKDQVAHRKRVYERLESMKGKFFKDEPNDRQTAVDELLQKCVIPRSLISPEDAMFVAKFMELLHAFSTPQLSSLQYFHKVSMKVSAIVLCATEREASNFGIFMKETLGLILRWYQNGATYDDEAIHDKIGMSLDLTDDKKRLAHRQFKSAYARWHQHLELVYTTALSTGEYMPIRNTLVVLTKLIDVFPAGRGTAEVILGIVEKLTNEDREDVKIMAKRYSALLTKRKASLINDRLLRTRNAPTKPPPAASSSIVGKHAPVEENKMTSNIDDGNHNESKRDSSNKPALSCAASQELESGEIVMGKSSNNSDISSLVKERNAERGSGGDHNCNSRGGRGGSADSGQDRRNRAEREESTFRQNISADIPRELGVDERRGRLDQRERELSPTTAGRSSSANSQTNELHERSGSASLKRERSPAPLHSRSGDRGNNSDSRRSSRERERGHERGQHNRGGRGDGDRRELDDVRSDSCDRHERNLRNRDLIHGHEENEVTRKSEASQLGLTRTEEPAKLALSPTSDHASVSAKLSWGARAERDSGKAEPSPLLDRKKARPVEQSEAALRRQLTADKEAKAKEQQSAERTRPIVRDRMRPPLSATVTGFSTSGASPTGAGTPTGGARKIVSLVSSSRKRERESVADGEAPTDLHEGKRRRDGGGSIGNWVEPKRGNDDRRKLRRNKGGGIDGNNGNQQQLQRDPIRGRQDRGVRSINGNFDRRGGHDDRRGNVGNANRRRDRNDTRTGRR